MKIDLTILEKYLKDGLIERNSHPILPLDIYNYSRECQFTSSWDGVTLNMRGTVIDREGNVVAKAFPKFFNYEEVVNEIPVSGDYVYVQEKADGSLGILFYYEGEWHLTTRGSFTSDQAKRGMEILKSKYNLRSFMSEMVYLLEIIYPENRIVVDYGNKGRVFFLSVTSGGKELHWTTAKSVFKASGIKSEDIVKTEQHFAFGPDLYRSLKEKNEENKEGFVLRFQPGNFRMKIKFEEYVRLHRLLTSFSNVDIWEILRAGNGFHDFLNKVPDEFDAWVKKWIEDLTSKYREIEFKAQDRYNDFMASNDHHVLNKAHYAEWVKGQDSHLQPILFRLFDNKSYSEYIWKLIRPTYQKPFWNKED